MKELNHKPEQKIVERLDLNSRRFCVRSAAIIQLLLKLNNHRIKLEFKEW